MEVYKYYYNLGISNFLSKSFLLAFAKNFDITYPVNLFCVYFFRDDQQLIASNNLKLDGGVVLGAAVWGGNRPSPVLRERINKGYELLSSGTIKYIILTGGGSPGEMTEAEVAKNEL